MSRMEAPRIPLRQYHLGFAYALYGLHRRRMATVSILFAPFLIMLEMKQSAPALNSCIHEKTPEKIIFNGRESASLNQCHGHSGSLVEELFKLEESF